MCDSCSGCALLHYNQSFMLDMEFFCIPKTGISRYSETLIGKKNQEQTKTIGGRVARNEHISCACGDA